MAYQPLGTHFDRDLPEDAKKEIKQYQDAYAQAQAKGDQAGMNAAHAAAERIRAGYEYSGGVDGSDYLGGPQQKPATPEWDFSVSRPEYDEPTTERPKYSPPATERPSYTSQYGERIDSVLDGVLNREPFHYDYQTDPLYDVYAQLYQREGRRAAEDALGNAAVLSGGMPASSAVTAASQARDYYAAQQADVIPQLQQQAYNMYLNDLSNQRNDLSNLMGLENLDYGQYRDLVGDWENDRNFGYNAYRDPTGDWQNDRDFGYGQYRDSLGDWQNDRNFSYGQYRDQAADSQWQQTLDYQRLQDALARNDNAEATEYQRNLYRAELLAAAGDYSGFEALGWTPQEIASLRAYNDRFSLA